MIRCFRPKIIEKGVEFGYWIKGWKAEEEVVKNKNQEEDCTSKKHLRVAVLSKKGTPITGDSMIDSRRGGNSPYKKNLVREHIRIKDLDKKIIPHVYFGL